MSLTKNSSDIIIDRRDIPFFVFDVKIIFCTSEVVIFIDLKSI